MKTALSVQTAKSTVDIIIITFNNLTMLDRCITSIRTNTGEPHRIIVVNNGDQDFSVPENSGVIVLKAGKNLGWTHGVNAGREWVLKNNPAPFIMSLNDDTQIVPHDYGWLTKMVNCFQLDPKIGVVGPTSNNIMGFQTTNHVHLPPAVETTYLSGMCMLTRREIIDEIGPLDCCQAGGDDLDWSMRLTQAGYKICICRRAFMLHFCSVTGKKLYGEYWNSPQQGEEINNWLIKKHGFKKWFNCISHVFPKQENEKESFVDGENELALQELLPIIKTGNKVLDLGCGGQKLHQDMIGIDIRRDGQLGVGANFDKPCATDLEADVTRLPFETKSVDGILAKHLFEHLIDPVVALDEWKRVLKDNGLLVII
ncbi:MAG: Methyltransferase type 11, partial [Parcubacteria group bacterium GW2011_GWC1_44_10]